MLTSLSGIITNLDSFLRIETGDSESNKHKYDSQEFITCLLEMLEAMMDIWNVSFLLAEIERVKAN